MKKFTIEPGVGGLPLKFGMTPSEVEKIAGPPDLARKIWNGDWEEGRKYVNLGYAKDTNRLYEIIFLPGSSVVFNQQDLFALDNPMAFLCSIEPSPQLWVGTVVFPNLGIRVSGYRAGDEPPKVIKLSLPSYFDEFRDGFEALDPDRDS